MMRDHWQPFPPDPNAPPFGASSHGQRHDGLERELRQLRLIGPAAGAELRRLVYGT